MKPADRKSLRLVKEKPIALRLMPEELAIADSISKKTQRSKSSLAREAYLKGLPLVFPELSPNGNTSIDSGAELVAASPC